MAIGLGINISSLAAQRQLAKGSSTLESVTQRLASGQRINKASDDAAGLSIATTLDFNSRILNKRISGFNDVISMTNIVDGAFDSMRNIIVRLTELAEQSANGALSLRQRRSLDLEGRTLTDEYNRVAKTTTFNGLRLLDGEGSVTLYGGDTSQNRILVDVSSNLERSVGDGTFTLSGSYNGAGVNTRTASADLNGDGHLDLLFASSSKIDFLRGNGDGTFSFGTTISNPNATDDLKLGDVNGDGNQDIVVWDSVGDISIHLGRGNGTFQPRMSIAIGGSGKVEIADFDGDGLVDLLANSTSHPQLQLLKGNGTGTFMAGRDAADTGGRALLKSRDFNGDGTDDLLVYGTGNGGAVLLGNGNGYYRYAQVSVSTFALNGVAIADFNRDGFLDFAARTNNADSVMLGNGDGTFRETVLTSVSQGGYSTGVADINGDGLVDITSGGGGLAAGNILGYFLGNGNGTFNSFVTVQNNVNGSYATPEFNDFDEDGDADVFYSVAGNQFNLLLQGDELEISMPYVSMLTPRDARLALERFKGLGAELDLQRGIVGAAVSRLGSAVSQFTSTRLSTLEAFDRIQSADVAADSAALVATKILQRAASAVLAQANQQPDLSLLLLNR